jgi:hypothetical protein
VLAIGPVWALSPQMPGATPEKVRPEGVTNGKRSRGHQPSGG